MRIEKFLKYTGWFLIVISGISLIAGWFLVDRETYERAKEVYDELSTNQYAEAQYIAAKTVYMSEISAWLTSVFGALIGGLVILGFAKMIELQNRIAEKLTRQSSNY